MPAHKNQHYVPRCYMRPFSAEGEGKAINLHNISSARSVQGASMKNQCSAPYVYGKEDLRLEHALGQIETAYASTLRRIIAGQRTTGEDIGYLLAFMILQYSRTKAAMERLRSMITGVEREVRASTTARLPETDTSARAMMIGSLGLYERAAPAVLDLRTCFLKNKSRVDFITSDDPVCFTSRFHAKRGLQSFGIASAGALFFMPLSPRLLMLCYDPNVYSVTRIGRVVETKAERDVEACNELQYLNALENVYFRDWIQMASIEGRSAAIRARRPSSRMRFSKFVEDGWASGGVQRYRRMKAGEHMERDSMVISTSPVHVFPEAWHSKVRFRRKMKFVRDESGGYRRPGTAS